MADEDLERENEQKTSSVHFLRFELDPSMKKALTAGANIRMGVDHPNYQATLDPLPGPVRESLLKDLRSRGDAAAPGQSISTSCAAR